MPALEEINHPDRYQNSPQSFDKPGAVLIDGLRTLQSEFEASQRDPRDVPLEPDIHASRLVYGTVDLAWGDGPIPSGVQEAMKKLDIIRKEAPEISEPMIMWIWTHSKTERIAQYFAQVAQAKRFTDPEDLVSAVVKVPKDRLEFDPLRDAKDPLQYIDTHWLNAFINHRERQRAAAHRAREHDAHARILWHEELDAFAAELKARLEKESEPLWNTFLSRVIAVLEKLKVHPRTIFDSTEE